MKLKIILFSLTLCLLFFAQHCSEHSNPSPPSVTSKDKNASLVEPLSPTVNWVVMNMSNLSQLDSFASLENPDFSGWANILSENRFGDDTLNVFYSIIQSYRNEKNDAIVSTMIPSKKQEILFFLQQHFVHQKNLFLETGYFVRYEMTGNRTYQLVWGKKEKTTISSSVFNVTGSGFLGFTWESKSAIVLRQGCGTECTKFVILPKDGVSSEHILLNPNEADLSRWR